MNRFQRRKIILEGKKTQGAFDPDQYYLESARRGRTARKLRHHLRRMTPVVLATPRWSQAHRFLDEITVDLAVGEPRIEARTLSMAPVQGRTVHESRAWLLRGIMEFCSLDLQGPVTQAVDRNGFRHVLAELLDLHPSDVLDVVSFYTHFTPHPKGKKTIMVCRSLSCGSRPRVETISPFSRKASDTAMAWFSNPPGLFRRSTT